jgi:hypothetical protein
MSQRLRCGAGIANLGCEFCEKAFHNSSQAKYCQLVGHDQCRRRAGHETLTGMEDHEWHLLDCGGAFLDDGTDELEWIPIYCRVENDGDIIA